MMDIMPIQPASQPPQGAPPARHTAAAKEFEQLVAGQLASAMLEASGVTSEGGTAMSGLWQQVLSDAVGRKIALGRGLGLADGVAKELARADGVRP